MASFAVDKNRYDKLSDVEDCSNPLTDAALKSLEGHLQPPHGLPSRPSETLSWLDLIVRVVLAAIVILFVFSVAKSFLEEPEDIIILLTSFTATKFNITNGILDANWQADIILKNPNAKFKAYVSRVDSWIYYTEPGNDGLGRGSKRHFSLDTKSNTTMIMKSSVSTKDPPQRWVVDEMEKEKERNGGSVNLGLEISLTGDFTKGLFLMPRPLDATVYCRDIKVVFPAGSTTGTLATGDKPMECTPDKSDW